MKLACKENPGIRVLRQEPFETLISFIISQNNNIKRITGIIDRLCESFGEKTDRGYMFPTLEKLVGVTAEELAAEAEVEEAAEVAEAETAEVETEAAAE